MIDGEHFHLLLIFLIKEKEPIEVRVSKKCKKIPEILRTVPESYKKNMTPIALVIFISKILPTICEKQYSLKKQLINNISNFCIERSL